MPFVPYDASRDPSAARSATSRWFSASRPTTRSSRSGSRGSSQCVTTAVEPFVAVAANAAGSGFVHLIEPSTRAALASSCVWSSECPMTNISIAASPPGTGAMSSAENVSRTTPRSPYFASVLSQPIATSASAAQRHASFRVTSTPIDAGGGQIVDTGGRRIAAFSGSIPSAHDRLVEQRELRLVRRFEGRRPPLEVLARDRRSRPLTGRGATFGSLDQLLQRRVEVVQLDSDAK